MFLFYVALLSLHSASRVCTQPGTGKTLLARAIACNIEASFLKVVSSAIVDKYIGESARLIREMFGYAKEKQPCVIFMDEIDAIGGRRFSEGTSADREIQRTLMELLNQLDGFDVLNKVKVIMATNRPDVLDPALLRPGRLDRKVEISLPNEQGRMEVLKIHAAPITKHGDIDYEAVCKLADGFNAADLRNVCTEAGMFAIRAERDYVIEEDFMKVNAFLLLHLSCSMCISSKYYSASLCFTRGIPRRTFFLSIYVNIIRISSIFFMICFAGELY